MTDEKRRETRAATRSDFQGLAAREAVTEETSPVRVGPLERAEVVQTDVRVIEVSVPVGARALVYLGDIVLTTTTHRITSKLDDYNRRHALHLNDLPRPREVITTEISFEGDAGFIQQLVELHRPSCDVCGVLIDEARDHFVTVGGEDVCVQCRLDAAGTLPAREHDPKTGAPLPYHEHVTIPDALRSLPVMHVVQAQTGTEPEHRLGPAGDPPCPLCYGPILGASERWPWNGTSICTQCAECLQTPEYLSGGELGYTPAGEGS